MPLKKRNFSWLEALCLYGFQVLLLFAFFQKLDSIEAMYKHGTIVKLLLPDDRSYQDSFLRRFSAPDILADWKKQKKNIVRIYLTGEPKEDMKRFEFIRSEARRLKYTYDTVDILKVHFINENTYGEFVHLVDIMSQDKIKMYMLYKDDFYIAGEKPPTDDTSAQTIRQLNL